MTSTHQLSEQWQQLLSNSELFESAQTVLTGSDYVMQWGLRCQTRAEELMISGDILRRYDDEQYSNALMQRLENVVDENSLQQQLRYFRQREMVRIIWRDLAGWADLAETVADLSALADACIQQSLALLHQWSCRDWGTPCNENSDPQQLIVLGMGKLGAGELNLSSDIDLIFTYPENGETQGGRRSLSNEEFFTRLGRKLIQAIDNVTVDGFVFRVDMRLRPYGDSGNLALSFDAMEDYYQTQGREWERYALIKARAITGEVSQQQRLMSLLRPFVYRRYLDYGVFDSLRELKAMIAGQLHKKGLEANIKLGSGGIREIEFIGQVFQLINGGRTPVLQQRPILIILDLLVLHQCLTQQAVNELKQAYEFLRRTEHRIQARADQQTHLLPSDELGQQRIAQLMGFSDWTDFLAVLTMHRARVKNHFEQVLAAPQADVEQSTPSLFSDAQQSQIEYLAQLGYQDAESSLNALKTMLSSHSCRNLSETGHDRLVKLLPLLVQAAANVKQPDACLARLIPLLESIMRRSAYMSLLVENPLALSQLIKLCSASSWVSQQLSKHPVLLDALLDPRTLYQVLERSDQNKALALALAAIDTDDLERQMDALRVFRQTATLSIAAADLTDLIALEKVGDHLSDLAELLLEKVMQLAWQHLVEKHGVPAGADLTDLSQSGFVTIAYGKKGGKELGYGSDLDLVFLCRDIEAGEVTDGDKPVDVLMFYTRLAQRMIHIMNSLMPSGMLYEVDMRLRPNGNSGLLVTTQSGFAQYQDSDAWTWEHQALVRARCVGGDSNLSAKFTQIRTDVLTKKRDQAVLLLDVSEMRAKMRAQLDKSTQQLFDLKQGAGGIADIEFMVQYAALAWSSQADELLIHTDNLGLLQALGDSGKLAKQDADLLAEAYRFYRHSANHCVLQDVPSCVPIEDVASYRTKVITLWQQWFA